MTQPRLVPLTEAERRRWYVAEPAALAARWAASGDVTPTEAVEQVERLFATEMPDVDAPGQHLWWVALDDRRLGPIWLRVRADQDVGTRGAVASPDLPDDLGAEAWTAVLGQVSTEASGLGVRRLVWDTSGSLPTVRKALAALGFEVAATVLRRPLPAEPTGPAAGLRLVPMTAARFTSYVERTIVDYADEIAASGLLPPTAAREKAEADLARLLPDGLGTPRHHLWTAHEHEDGPEIGVLWFDVTPTDGGARAYVLDIEVDAARRGRGLGRALMEAGHARMASLGATSVGLNVFGHNARARALYDSLGYQVAASSHRLDLAAGPHSPG